MQVLVLVDGAGEQGSGPYTYRVPEKLHSGVRIGCRVLVPLGGRKVRGYVLSAEEDDHALGYKDIEDILDGAPSITPELINLSAWIAGHYLVSQVRVLKAMIPAGLEKSKARRGKSKRNMESASRPAAEADGLETAAENAMSPVTAESAASLEDIPGLYCYRVSPAVNAGQIEKLRRKAPRQAAALEKMTGGGQPLEENDARSVAGLYVLESLVTKGLVLREPVPMRTMQAVLLNNEQEEAAALISGAVRGSQHESFLLHGVTGSGKTEVYMRAIEAARQAGRQSMVLIPEIGLTEQIVHNFRSRFGSGISVLHSRLTDYQRAVEYHRIAHGWADIIVGARSAVFAPFRSLGLVIVDEEQESSYRQEETPRYDARMVARRRAVSHNAVYVAGSATPSVETYHKALQGFDRLLRLNEKVASGGQRQMVIVDLKEELKRGMTGSLSQPMLEGIEKCLAEKKQAIIFLNRRGFSPAAVCQECGRIRTCRACEVSLNYHRDLGQLVCHYCGRHVPFDPVCPHCQSRMTRLTGTGTQKIEYELRSLFPGARVVRMDADNTRENGNHKRIYEEIRQGLADIVIGTQMIAKGFDFPGVTLVGIVNADAMFALPDFRAREKAFQLLTQVSGRAGRGSSPGTVILQTYDPSNPLYDWVRTEDYDCFYTEESSYRTAYDYPPYAQLIKVMFTGVSPEAVQDEALFARMLTEEILGESEHPIEVLGPAPCLISKVKHRYRYQMILKGHDMDTLRAIARYIIDRGNASGVRVDADVDPLLMF